MYITVSKAETAGAWYGMFCLYARFACSMKNFSNNIKSKTKTIIQASVIFIVLKGTVKIRLELYKNYTRNYVDSFLINKFG